MNTTAPAPAPPRAFAALLVLIGLTLVVGGGGLILLGGSAYYALAGIATGMSGLLLWRGNRRGPWVYAAMLGTTLVWSLWEAGLDGWALAPRLIGPCVLGLVFFTPYVRHRLVRGPAWDRRHRAVVAVLAGVGCAGGTTAAGTLLVAHATAAPDISTVAPPSGPGAVSPGATAPAGDWPVWGNTAAGTRYSPLDGISPANVAHLSLAWQFHTLPIPPGPKGGLETTPLKIGDTLYLCDGVNRIYALDPDTGRPKWTFDPHVSIYGIVAATCRGVAYYHNPAAAAGAPCADRVITSTIDAKLWAVDARTGTPCTGFGQGGQVDLKQGMGNPAPGYYATTSAPTIARGRIVVGGWVTDNQSIGEPPGVVRAFDAVTGAFAWAFDMGRPDDHAEPGPGLHYVLGTPNVWAPPSVDEALGLVYLPTGNATPDFWGGLRTAEMDRFSSSTIALDAQTGTVRWSFQTTHHDLWDYDEASQPTLIDVAGPDGGSIPALIQPTKRGQTFVLDRRTGTPIVPVVERAAPTGAAPGDRLSPTQPYSLMPSFAGPKLRESMMWGITPVDQLWCRIKFRQARYEGDFTPPGIRPSIGYPGYSGGSSWGGVSVDPLRRVMVFNVNRFAQYGRLVPRAEADRLGMRPITNGVGEGGLGAPQMGTRFAAIIRPFMSPLGVPCQQPPYGVIGAVSLTTHTVLWSHPLGSAQDSGPLGWPTRLPITLGTPNLGGSVVTKTGLVFIGATQERMLRALDIATGAQLWSSRLPAGAQSTPMTYRSDRSGQQYVVVAAGGNILLGSRQGHAIVAYALPPLPR